MAKVANPLIGKTSGSIGAVTFSSWKGIGVMKTKPTVVANPQTVKQTAQRAAFSRIVLIYRLLASVITLGMKQQAIKKSAFNAFSGINLKTCFDLSAPPAATFDPLLLSISKGTMTPTPINTFGVDGGDGSLDMVWTYGALLPGQSADDVAIAAYFNETKNIWGTFPTTKKRSESSITILNHDNEETDVIYGYLAFCSPDGNTSSDSVVRDSREN